MSKYVWELNLVEPADIAGDWKKETVSGTVTEDRPDPCLCRVEGQEMHCTNEMERKDEKAIAKHMRSFLVGLAAVCGTMVCLDSTMSIWYAIGVAVGGWFLCKGVNGLIRALFGRQA